MTCFKFGDDWFSGLASAEGQILPFPIDFDGRSYNTLTLPCERVIKANWHQILTTWMFWVLSGSKQAWMLRAAFVAMDLVFSLECWEWVIFILILQVSFLYTWYAWIQLCIVMPCQKLRGSSSILPKKLRIYSNCVDILHHFHTYWRTCSVGYSLALYLLNVMTSWSSV